MPTMKAVVIHQPGPAEVLLIEDRPIPEPRENWALIKVRAFGLNRSELFTRRGQSPSVMFPRILGIEAVGEIAAAPGSALKPGDKVATAMGGMGRAFDGGYAEYTLVPISQIQKIDTSLDWATLGALPEMVQTAYGALYTSLRLARGHALLIRGGTTSVGLMAAILAKQAGARVIATTRKRERKQDLLKNGADEVVIDNGSIVTELRRQHPDGVDKVLELVGTTTLLDSLQATAMGGTVCMAGMVGDEWELERFSPMGAIPTAVNLTVYSGGPDEFMATPLQDVVKSVEAGSIKPPIGAVFPLDRIAEAHQTMENNQAAGKIVVTT